MARQVAGKDMVQPNAQFSDEDLIVLRGALVTHIAALKRRELDALKKQLNPLIVDVTRADLKIATELQKRL